MNKQLRHNPTIHGLLAALLLACGARAAAASTPTIPYTVAQLQSIEIVTGERMEGDIAALRAADEKVLAIQSGFGNDLVALHMLETRFVARTDIAMPIALALTFHAHSTEHGRVALRLKNVESGQFELVAQTAIAPEPVQFFLSEIAALRYINQEGEIQLSLQQVVAVPIFSHTFRTRIDWLEIGVY